MSMVTRESVKLDCIKNILLERFVAGSLTTNKNPCESNSYGVFTDVSKFNKWIASNLLN